MGLNYLTMIRPGGKIFLAELIQQQLQPPLQLQQLQLPRLQLPLQQQPPLPLCHLLCPFRELSFHSFLVEGSSSHSNNSSPLNSNLHSREALNSCNRYWQEITLKPSNNNLHLNNKDSLYLNSNSSLFLNSSNSSLFLNSSNSSLFLNSNSSSLFLNSNNNSLYLNSNNNSLFPNSNSSFSRHLISSPLFRISSILTLSS